MKLKAIEVATEASVSLKKTHPTLAGRLYAVLTTPKYLRCTTVAAVVFLGQQMVGWNTFVSLPPSQSSSRFRCLLC